MSVDPLSTVADAYQDYADVLQGLDAIDDGDTAENAYEKIMSKEDARIKLINRIVDHRAKAVMDGAAFWNRPLIEVLQMVAATWSSMFHETVAYTTQHKNMTLEAGRMFVHRTFWETDRKIYTGLFVVGIALLIFFIDISE
jgi:hypothetical protein